MVARPTQPGSGVRVCGVRTQGGLGRVYLDDITASVEVCAEDFGSEAYTATAEFLFIILLRNQC